MITIRKSADRGHANHGWLDSRHSFSFADYYDPEHVRFRALRVINEDRVVAGQGFGMHPHRDMEIISYVISGALQHQDSMGSKAVMRAGDVQRISAGTGILHSEYNPSREDPVHFLQIWLMPDEKSVKPDYTERSYREIEPGRLHLIASKTGRDGSISIHQDADVFVAKVPANQSLRHPLASSRAGWVQVIGGELSIQDEMLAEGDGAAISESSEITVTAKRDAHFLLFDLN